MFLTTHDMTVADELCDRVAFIVNGEIRLVASPHERKLAHGARTVVMEFNRDGRPGRREFPLDGLGADIARPLSTRVRGDHKPCPQRAGD